MENTIKCPHCNTEINIKSALQKQVSLEYQTKEAEILAREKVMRNKGVKFIFPLPNFKIF